MGLLFIEVKEHGRKAREIKLIKQGKTFSPCFIFKPVKLKIRVFKYIAILSNKNTKRAKIKKYTGRKGKCCILSLLQMR